MKGLTVVLSRNFWPSLFFFFFSFFFPSLASVRAFLHLLFFLFPFTLGDFFFFLHCVWFFFFFFPLGLVFSSSFFLFLFPSSFTGFGLQFLLLLFFPSSFIGFRFLDFFVFFFFFPGFDEFGYWEKKKNCTEWQIWGPQIVWKILNDDKWVMVSNG